jgi:hypothetical protein
MVEDLSKQLQMEEAAPFLGKAQFLLYTLRFSKPKKVRFEDHTYPFPSLLTVEDFGKLSGHRGAGKWLMLEGVATRFVLRAHS